MSLISEDEKTRSPLWAINPRSRRMILKDGPTYARLVKMGEIEDEDLRRQWSERQEATRARRIAAVSEARTLGLGPAGGHVGRGAAQPPAPQPEPVRRAEPARRAEPPARQPRDPRDDVRALILEHREALTRPGLTKAEALEMLRAARALREPEPYDETPVRAPAPMPRTTGGRWAVRQPARSAPRD